jgi:hypothetical protein
MSLSRRNTTSNKQQRPDAFAPRPATRKSTVIVIEDSESECNEVESMQVLSPSLAAIGTGAGHSQRDTVLHCAGPLENTLKKRKITLDESMQWDQF